MNQVQFAARNILDKLGKAIGNWETSRFYWQTYIMSRFDTVEPEIYVVSYPKCGRTWLRIMLQRCLELQQLSLQCFNDKSLVGIAGGPVIRFEHDQGNWVPAPLRTDQLSFRATKYQKKKVLLMVRDPRDILVSSWHHLKYRERIYQRGLPVFIRDDLVGIRKIIAFTNMWIENSHIPSNFSLLSYEAMHSNPVSSLSKVLEFMEIDVEQQFLHTAVEDSSFDRMQRMELRGSLREPWMKPGARKLKESMKVRRGKVGGYRDELRQEDIEFLNKVIKSELSAELTQYY